METERVLKTLVFNSTLTRLIAQEDFIAKIIFASVLCDEFYIINFYM
jgi:hypothetical protein